MKQTDQQSPFAIPQDPLRRRMLSPEYQALVRANKRLPPPHVCNVNCERERSRIWRKEHPNG